MEDATRDTRVITPDEVADALRVSDSAPLRTTSRSPGRGGGSAGPSARSRRRASTRGWPTSAGGSRSQEGRHAPSVTSWRCWGEWASPLSPRGRARVTGCIRSPTRPPAGSPAPGWAPRTRGAASTPRCGRPCGAPRPRPPRESSGWRTGQSRSATSGSWGSSPKRSASCHATTSGASPRWTGPSRARGTDRRRRA